MMNTTMSAPCLRSFYMKRGSIYIRFTTQLLLATGVVATAPSFAMESIATMNVLSLIF